MSALVIFLLLGFFPLMAKSKVTVDGRNVQYCSINQNDVIGSIGVVVDQSSRLGKEQKVALEMAVHDFNRWSHCSKLDLHFQDSQGNSARAVSAVTELVNKKQAHVVLGPLTLQEATLLRELDKVPEDIPIISTAPMSTSLPLLPSQPPAFIRMGTDVDIQMQCIAAIVGHFRWRKVIAIYEHSNSFSADFGLVTHLSDSLQAVVSVVEHHMAFPRVGSVPNLKEFIEEELSKMRGKSVKVFTILESSLEFAIILFEKAKELGMLDKGYVWIVSDGVVSLFDSVKTSFILKYMQGVIGLKTNYFETSHSFQEFEQRFRRKYRSEYPEEEKYSSPSIYALRAYDSAWVVAKAMLNSKINHVNSKDFANSILSCNFDGLSGNISFKNGALLQKPVYQLVNMIGKSYRLIAFWSPEFGFSKDLIEHDGTVTKSGNGLRGDLGSIYWAGGELTVPKGWTLGGIRKPLRIGAPADGAFHNFVNVSFDQSRNETTITGFSIKIFEASVRQLPYHLPYVLVPCHGSYDQIVAEVHNKNLDAAVGDIGIVADRYEIADFSQPYLETGILMVVNVKPDLTKTRFMILRAFELKMWMLVVALSMLTGAVIWLNEHANDNPEFRGLFPQNIGSMLWFSVTLLSFAQRESIRSNLSRLVLATWLFVTVVVTTCFTAAVTSTMTVPKIEPSVVDIDYLLGTDAPVGCNNNSQIRSSSDYPEAFQKGDIKAAFLAVPHAKIFVAKYCKGYTIAGSSFKLGGFGFVFQKGSPLANDISEAILKITSSGEINRLEKQMLSSLNCTSSTGGDSQGPGKIGIEPFFVLFLVSGSLLVVAFLNAIARLLEWHCLIYDFILASLINRRAPKWALLLLTRCFTKFGTRHLRVPIMQSPSTEMNIPRNAMEPTLEYH